MIEPFGGRNYEKIEVIFPQERLEILKDNLFERGIKGATIYQVSGCGNQLGWVQYHRGQEVMMNVLPKVLLMTVVADNELNAVVDIIKKTLNTGHVGDGKIFISTVDECIRVRTDETGENAI